MNLQDPYEGQKFSSFEVLKKYLEEYGQRKYVKFWIRSSHTINSLKSKSAKRMNPDLKYYCMKFACIFGGEKSRCRGYGIRRSTTYRNLGCPCTINAVVGEDGNHVKLETVILEHNHALCKSLYDSLKRSKSKVVGVETEAKSKKSRLSKKNEDLKNSELPVNEISEENKIEYSDKCVNGILEQPFVNRTVKLEPDRTNAFEIEPPTTEANEFQDYLQQIKQKYGNNIKIIFVNKENSDNGEGSMKTKNIKSKFVEEDEEDILSYKEDNEICNLLALSKEKEICRLCLSTSNSLTPIFKPSLPLESTILSFKIMSCASIEVSHDDELPSNICATCEEILDVAYNFRMKCENSDSVLRKAYLSNRFTDINGVSNSFEIYQENIDDRIKEEPDEKLVSQDNVKDCLQSVKDEKDDSLELDNNINDNAGHELYAKIEVCPICEDAFDTYPDVLQHMKQHNDIENILLSCKFCSVIFTTVRSLLEHMNEHVIDVNNVYDSKLISCSQCELSFFSSEDAKAHEETHLQKGQEIFNSEGETQKYNPGNHGYLCNVCGKILKSKDRFQSHRNTHEGLRPHVCLKCGRGFADRKNMHQHYDIVHLRKAKHECPICHKRFYAPTKMKSHITMHYDVKPFSCDVCNKTFRLRMNMIKHKKTHSNERPHKCDKCNAAFIDKNLLTRHSYVHGGVRPYVCPLCGHRFTLKFNLKKHLVSGRCNSKTKVKDINSEYNVDDWAAITASQSAVCLTGRTIKCDENEQSGFPKENESVRVDILNEYEEKT